MWNQDGAQAFGLSSLGTVELFAELGQAAGRERVDQQRGGGCTGLTQCR